MPGGKKLMAVPIQADFSPYSTWLHDLEIRAAWFSTHNDFRQAANRAITMADKRSGIT
jgi:hypothetical protein